MTFIDTFEKRFVFVIALVFFVVTASVGGPLFGMVAAAAACLVWWFLKWSLAANFPTNTPTERYEEFQPSDVEEIFFHKFAMTGYILAALVVVSNDFHFVAQVIAAMLALVGVVLSTCTSLEDPLGIKDDSVNESAAENDTTWTYILTSAPMLAAYALAIAILELSGYALWGWALATLLVFGVLVAAVMVKGTVYSMDACK